MKSQELEKVLRWLKGAEYVGMSKGELLAINLQKEAEDCDWPEWVLFPGVYEHIVNTYYRGLA